MGHPRPHLLTRMKDSLCGTELDGRTSGGFELIGDHPHEWTARVRRRGPRKRRRPLPFRGPRGTRFVMRAPRKYHAPLTTTVNHGSLRSIQNAIRPASICKGAGMGVGPLRWDCFCQGEGRGFESRRPLQRKSRYRRCEGRKSAYRGACSTHLEGPFQNRCPYFGRDS
jgi:hypothetical protein